MINTLPNNLKTLVQTIQEIDDQLLHDLFTGVTSKGKWVVYIPTLKSYATSFQTITPDMVYAKIFTNLLEASQVRNSYFSAVVIEL